jgi:hypothetical protein
MYVSEAVLAKLEEAQFASPAAGEWEGEAEYKAVQDQLNELTAQWNAQKISNELFFKLRQRKRPMFTGCAGRKPATTRRTRPARCRLTPRLLRFADAGA